MLNLFSCKIKMINMCYKCNKNKINSVKKEKKNTLYTDDKLRGANASVIFQSWLDVLFAFMFRVISTEHCAKSIKKVGITTCKCNHNVWFIRKILIMTNVHAFDEIKNNCCFAPKYVFRKYFYSSVRISKYHVMMQWGGMVFIVKLNGKNNKWFFWTENDVHHVNNVYAIWSITELIYENRF